MFVFTSTTALARVAPREAAALEALYNATDGPQWSRSRAWLHGDPCADEWEGVTCTMALPPTILCVKPTDSRAACGVRRGVAD